MTLTTRVGEHERLLSPGGDLGLEGSVRRHRRTLDGRREQLQDLCIHPRKPWRDEVALQLGDLCIELRFLLVGQRLEDVALDVFGGGGHLRVREVGGRQGGEDGIGERRIVARRKRFEGHVPEDLGVHAISDAALEGLFDGEDDEHGSEGARGLHERVVDGDTQQKVLYAAGGGLVPSQVHRRGAEMVDKVTPDDLGEEEGVVEEGRTIRRPSIEEDMLIRHDDGWLCNGVEVGKGW